MRDHLLELDSIPPAGRAAYDASLERLFHEKLGTWGRIRYLVPTVGGLGMFLLLGSLALTEPRLTPVRTRLTLGVLALVGACWFIIAGRIVNRGSVHLIRDKRTVAGAALVFTLLQAIWFSAGPVQGTHRIGGLLLSLCLVGVASAGLVVQRIRESELRIRAEILRARLAANETPPRPDAS